MPGVALHRVTRLDLPVTPWRWPFAAARRHEIDAHFEARRSTTPQLWNGRVLLARNSVFAEGCFRAQCFETDFASFLAWRDWGFPDASVINGFGAGALRGSDGVFVLGEMAAHTANAGKIYFPCGTPEPDDVVGGRLDISGSIAREVAEETGLAASDYRAADDWFCVVDGPLVALLQVLDASLTGQALRRTIAANLAKQASPELGGVHLVGDRRDFTAAMPRFVTAFIEAQLSPS